MDGDGPHNKGGHRAEVSGDAEGWCYPHVSFVSELTLQLQNPSDTQTLQAPVHSSTFPLARRGRGRPLRSRAAIAVGNTAWEVTKIAGDQQSGEGRVLLPLVRPCLPRYVAMAYRRAERFSSASHASA